MSLRACAGTPEWKGAGHLDGVNVAPHLKVGTEATKWPLLKSEPRSVFRDLVLSKLRLVDARGPLGVRVSDEDSCPRAMQARLADSPLGKVADRAWRGVCSMGGESSRRIKLRTNGTFVFYEGVGKIDESRTEVFDGAWVVKNDKGPWASVDLFGRRHLSEESWSPAEGERAQLGCPCTLKLWEAQGPHTVTLGGVTFPVSPKAEP